MPSPQSPKDPILHTSFFDWSCKYFTQSVMRVPDERDPESEHHHQREYRFMRNASLRGEAREEQMRAGELFASQYTRYQ